MQVIDWLMCQVDFLRQINLAFCQPNHKHKRCPPFPAHTHSLSPSFPFFLPHWRATVALMVHILLSDVGVLQPQQRASYPVWGIFSPIPKNTGLFAYKGRFHSIFSQRLHSSEEALVLLTPAAWTLIRLDMKNMFCVPSQEGKKELWDLQHHYWQELFLLLNCWQPFLAECQ